MAGRPEEQLVGVDAGQIVEHDHGGAEAGKGLGGRAVRVLGLADLLAEREHGGAAPGAQRLERGLVTVPDARGSDHSRDCWAPPMAPTR